MPYSDQDISLMLKEISSAESDRGNWESHWQEIAQVINPFNDQFNQESSPGETKMHFVYEASGIHANQLLASGLFSLLTNPAQEWFQWRMAEATLNQRYEVLEWLDEVTRIAFHEINRPEAGFNNAAHECYLEFGSFGTCLMYASELLRKNSLLFQSLPLSQCYVLEGEEGLIDTVFRKYKRTVRQLVQRFGIDVLHENIRKLWDEKKYEDKIDSIHIIKPNTYNQVKFPFVSIYLDRTNKHIFHSKGFQEFPIQVPRFTKTGYEVYGRGPGSVALPDVKMLQEMMRTTLRAAQKVVDPPLMAPDNGFLNPIRTTPGGINYYRSGTGEKIEPMNWGSRPDIAYEMIQDIRKRIQEIFYVDQLQLQEGPQMTATEVLQRTEEKLRLMGPLMGRLQTEFLGPMLDRVFGLLQRAGKFPPPPGVIQDKDFRVVYTSPIARAQEQTEANGLLRATQLLQPFVAGKPEMMDIINGDELSRGVFNMYSVSPRYLNKDTEIKQIRDKRAADQEKMMMAELMQKAGKGAESLSKAGVNNADIGETVGTA